MTGSAQTWSEAVRLIMLLGEKKKERVWERKGLAIGPGRRLADFMLERVWASFFNIFLSLGRVWKSIGKSRPKVTPGLPKWRENAIQNR